MVTGDSTTDYAEVGRLGQLYNEWASTGLLPTVWYMAIRQFMQALQIVKPATVVSLLAVGANVGFNYLFIWGLGPDSSWQGLGFKGSPIATTVSLCLQLGLFCAYAFGYKKYHRPYWGGWSMAVFRKTRLRRWRSACLRSPRADSHIPSLTSMHASLLTAFGRSCCR